MEEARDRIVSLSTASGAAEERMLGADLVSEMVARKDRGAGIKQIARELGVDRKTVRRWLKLGAWQPRQVQRRARQLDRFAPFIERRAPEVGFNGAVLYRELQGLVFTGGIVQVQRWLRPQRERRKWSELATVRFETGPGEQAQVDYGQLKVWIGEQFGLTLSCDGRHAAIACITSSPSSILPARRCNDAPSRTARASQ